jgi:transposase
MAMELSEKSWVLFFGTGLGTQQWVQSIGARNLKLLTRVIASAKKRLGLPAAAPVVSCYEAGRDGFWLHRWLEQTAGIRSLVVDSASIEVNRRQRRAKSDRLDGGKLLTMLSRHLLGERKVWSVVQVPSQEDEDLRHLSREMDALKDERKRHLCRIKSLLVAEGLSVKSVKRLPKQIDTWTRWDGSTLGEPLRARLRREWERLELVETQMRQLEAQCRQLVRQSSQARIRQVGQMQRLRGIGERSSWTFVVECFGWRPYRNRREAGAIVGLTPTPYQSGNMDHQQGISKAGNRRVRTMAVEIAWSWLRFQPQSELSRWFIRRFGRANKRQRRIGIVALARKLVVQLWRYLETGELPPGAVLAA